HGIGDRERVQRGDERAARCLPDGGRRGVVHRHGDRQRDRAVAGVAHRRGTSGMTAAAQGTAARRDAATRSYRELIAQSTARTLARRRVMARVMFGSTYLTAIVATLPLILIVWHLLERGA